MAKPRYRFKHMAHGVAQVRARQLRQRSLAHSNAGARLGVIRISGKEAYPIISKMFHSHYIGMSGMVGIDYIIL